MAYSFLYAHIYFTLILLLLLLLLVLVSSTTPPPLATTCVAIEDFSDGHFNVYSNECRGKSPYCVFACIQHQHRLRSPLSSSSSSSDAASSSCFLVRFFDSGLSEVDRFNCSDLAYCSLSCLGPGDPTAAAADRSRIDLAVDGPVREVFDPDRRGGGGGEVESAEEAKCGADLYDADFVEADSIPAIADYVDDM